MGSRLLAVIGRTRFYQLLQVNALVVLLHIIRDIAMLNFGTAGQTANSHFFVLPMGPKYYHAFRIRINIYLI